jgi:OOP family OmpA-OmpF porin
MHLRLSFLALLLSISSSVAAQATGFSINRFDVAERGSDWFVGESLDIRGHGRGALGLVLDYAYKPLVLYDTNGKEHALIVSDQLFVHLGGSLILWDRLRLAANVPIVALTEGHSASLRGETFQPNTGTSLGDIRLGADLRLVGSYGGPAQLAIGAQVYLPTGERTAFAGDGKLRVMPRLLLAGDVGVEREGAFKKATTPFEVLFGVHYRPTDWRFGIGAGPGLTRGLGAPAVRVVATLEWAPSIPSDRDHDTIYDEDDACPDVPGVRNADPKKNGCPPPKDRDGDGVLDDVDACPDVFGQPNADPAKNGCPPPRDRDGDGVIDQLDACPDVPGVATDDPTTNGCPLPLDSDGDGILDRDDACPQAPGPADPDPAKNGCPKARIEQGQIKIIERVEFLTDSARILPSSDAILDAVHEILREHPEIKSVSIEGHTDNVGGAAYNKPLSQRRAQSVLNWLVQHGVAPERLSAQGFGLERPIDVNTTAEGRQRNRRVEFHILETGSEAE